MEKICDLHTHSIYSDGTYTPTEIIKASLTAGLSSVALCDHNTVDGLPEFLNAASSQTIEAIAGVEFSVDYSGTELHLLALYVPEKHHSKIANLMKSVTAKKEESNKNLISSLNSAGYEISFDKIKQSTPNGKFNRAHIATELTRLGYTQSVKEAFGTLLSPDAGYYKEPERLSFFEMISFIKSIDSVPVLAHPFLNLNENELKKLLPIARDIGLSGMECYYSLYDEQTTEKSLILAKKFDLKCSGGSDFHGDNKPDIKLGTGKGNLKIPYEWSLLLKKM